jgi:hypothetical protein
MSIIHFPALLHLAPTLNRSMGKSPWDFEQIAILLLAVPRSTSEVTLSSDLTNDKRLGATQPFPVQDACVCVSAEREQVACQVSVTVRVV